MKKQKHNQMSRILNDLVRVFSHISSAYLNFDYMLYARYCKKYHPIMGQAVTKSGTGLDVGLRDVGLKDTGTWGRGDDGTQGRGEKGAQELGDVTTQGRDKQTTPEFALQVSLK